MGNVKRKQVRAENGRMGSLHALLTRYPDERSCERRLMEVRWPEGWECERCPRHLSVTTGTATRHSRVRPRRRFHVMWLLARSEGACSPSKLAAQVGVSENTATFMLERLRGAMARSECLRRAVG